MNLKRRRKRMQAKSAARAIAEAKTSSLLGKTKIGTN